VFSSESQNETVLQRASDLVRRSFSSAYNFQAKSVFIATWDNVGYNPKGADKVSKLHGDEKPKSDKT